MIQYIAIFYTIDIAIISIYRYENVPVNDSPSTPYCEGKSLTSSVNVLCCLNLLTELKLAIANSKSIGGYYIILNNLRGGT